MTHPESPASRPSDPHAPTAGMQALRACLVLGALALAGVIAWAFTAASFFASFAAIVADPWGVVTLVDLYLGFGLAALVILAVERPGMRGLLLVLAVFTLGNVVTALWAAWRAPVILARLKQ